MAFPYKHILVIGATSGIGRAMADKFAASGVKVTAVGRRKERLDEWVQKHGKGKNVASLQYDISQSHDNLVQFVDNVMKQNSDIDSIMFNAGIQHSYINFSDPMKFDFAKFQEEINVNFLSFVVLAQAFLPHLLAKKTPTSLIFTGSNLSIVPASWLPGYSASKAALNVYTLCLRERLNGTSVKVIEVSPPVVQTELHDYMGQERGRSLGMPLDAFTGEAYKGLIEGKDQVVVGSVGDKATFDDIVEKRRASFDGLTQMMKAMMASHK